MLRLSKAIFVQPRPNIKVLRVQEFGEWLQIIMQIQLGRFIFKPHLGISLLFIFFLPILLGLSYWQWQRGIFKQEQLEAYKSAQMEEHLPFKGASSLPLAEFQPISVKGKWDTRHQFYLDNQMHAGQAGFEVLVPLQLSQAEWILVNLGWLPRNIHRAQLPTFPALPDGEIALKGRADFPSSKYLLLGTYLEVIEANKIIIQAIDYQKLSNFLGYKLLPIVMLADPEPNNPFIRDWQPPTSIPPEKHFGYSIQWLLLAITLCVLYIIFCTKKI